MGLMFWIFLILAICSATLFIVLSKGQRGLLSFALKAIASFCFILLAMGAVYNKGINLPYFLVVMGLVASLVGDVVLALPDMKEMQAKSQALTLVGGLSFAVAHCFYLAAMIILFGFRWWVILVAVALGLIFFFGNKMIGKLDYGKLTYGMPFYATFVSLVVAESIMAIINGSATVAIMLVVGFVLFWLSDIVLMNIYFGNKTDKQKVNYYYFNLAFYYGAQILIALSLWFI